MRQLHHMHDHTGAHIRHAHVVTCAVLVSFRIAHHCKVLSVHADKLLSRQTAPKLSKLTTLVFVYI